VQNRDGGGGGEDGGKKSTWEGKGSELCGLRRGARSVCGQVGGGGGWEEFRQTGAEEGVYFLDGARSGGGLLILRGDLNFRESTAGLAAWCISSTLSLEALVTVTDRRRLVRSAIGERSEFCCFSFLWERGTGSAAQTATSRWRAVSSPGSRM